MSYKTRFMHSVQLAIFCLFFGFAGQSVAADDMACSCTAGACGNDAVGGDQGDIFNDLSQATVNNSFKTNPNTGWTCVVPKKTRGTGGPLGCFCAGYCGNGGIGADPDYFDLGLNQDTINKNYGGGKAGNKTGWLCGNYRGTYQPPKSACYWMKNAAPYPWVPAPQGNVSKSQCFSLDSCDGGKGTSGGGCYKWATDANAPRQPW